MKEYFGSKGWLTRYAQAEDSRGMWQKYVDEVELNKVQDPSSMVQEPRNMYAQGQLVRNTVDGSRPGYNGVKPDARKLSKGKLTVANKYAKYLNSFDKDSKYYVSADDWKNLATEDRQKISNIMRNTEGKFVKNFSRQLRFSTLNEKKLMDTFGLTVEDFKKHGRFGVPRNHPEYNHIFRFTEKGFKFTTVDLLNSKTRNNIMANFELPEGVKKWDFDRYRYGLPGTGKENRNVGSRILSFVNEKKSFEIASDWSKPEGWAVGSMHRVYKNQTEIVNGVRVPKKGVKLTYEPLYDKVNGKKIIVGFKDNTSSGGGKKYYGLKKYHNKFNGTDWIKHKDYSRIVKFVDIAKRTNNAPNEVIQSLLKGKGIDPNIRLNDILSYDRYYSKLSTTTPKALLESQIVKHHMSGVGSKNLARAAATKDIQLLTGAANQTARDLEIKLAKNKFLSAADNQTLKNMGAKIKDAGGKVYGGGYLDPERQFSSIEKQAQKMVGKKSFNLEGFETYLKALCPKGSASGGRIGYNTAGAVTGTAKCGQKQLQKLLFKGGGTEVERGLVQRIISGGGKFALSMLNPRELVRLKNLVGPAALGIMGAYEVGSVTDDVLRLGKPLDEALAANWLFKAFMPHSEEFEKQRNLLQSGNLTGPEREYALEMMKWEQATKEFKRIENMKESQLVDVGGYGNLDGTSMYSREQEEKDKKKLMERFGRIKDYALVEGSAAELKNKALMDEYEDLQTAGTGKYTSAGEHSFRLPGQRPIKYDENYELASSRIFGGPQRLVNMAPRPKNMGRGPMTGKGKMKLDFSIPGYTPYDKDITTTPLNKGQLEGITQHGRNIGYIHPRFGEMSEKDIKHVQAAEKWRQITEKINPRRFLGTQYNAEGGRAGYMGGGITNTRVGFKTGTSIASLLKKFFKPKKTITIKRGESGTIGASGNSKKDFLDRYYFPPKGSFTNQSADARYFSKLGGPEGKPKVLTAEITPAELREGYRLRSLDSKDPEIGDIIIPQSAKDKVKTDYYNTIRARIEKILKNND